MESDKERSHRQPVMADEVQTFKALITIHKVLQEGHPVSVKEAQQNVNWIESLARGVSGEGLRGTFFPFDVCSGDIPAGSIRAFSWNLPWLDEF
jgi:ANTH domain